MQIADRRGGMARISLAALPLLPENWEVSVFPAPFSVKDISLRGLLLVVEVRSAAVRMAIPVTYEESLATHLRQAFLEPMAPLKVGRPKSVRVNDAALLAEIQPVLAEAGVLATVVTELPMTFEAMTMLLRDLGAPQAPGLTTNLPTWRAVLAEMARLAPWRHIRDDVRFRMAGGVLDGCVAVIIGHDGENRGIVLYPSSEALEHHLHVRGTAMREGVRMALILLEPPEEVSATEREACTKAQLVFPGPLYAKAYTVESGQYPAISPEGQVRLLAATQAVLALAPVFPQRGSLEVPTVVGTVTVRADAEVQAPSQEWFFSRAYQMMLVHARDSRSPSALLPGLLFKMRKADAVAIAGRFKQIYRLLLSERAGVIQLEAEMEDGRRLVLAQADAHTGELKDHLQVPEVFLILSGGGTQRQSFSGKDAVDQVRVPVVLFG